MNKPLKMLIAVAVLAFAASGLYYAWMTPAGPELDPVEPREPKGPTVLSRTPGGEAREEIVMGAGEMPTPVPVSPEPSGGPPAGAFEPTNPDKVEGFVPDTRPMRQLPDALPGFDPVASDSGSSSAIANASPAGTPPSTPPATGAAAPASTAPATPAAVPAEPTLPSLPPAAPAASPVAPVAAPASASPVAPKPAEPVVQSYTVKEGDTVISIWRSLRGTERGWDALVSANPGLDPARLKIGQVLKVPAATTAAATAAPQVSAAGGPVAGTTYTIRSGDTLSTISAAAYGSARHWNLIHQANQSVIGADPAALKVGTRITIPPKPADGVKSSGAAGGSPTPPSR